MADIPKIPREISEIMAADKVTVKRASVIQNSEFIAYAEYQASRKKLTKEEKQKISRDDWNARLSDEQIKPVEQPPTVVDISIKEPAKPKIIDPHRGRFVKVNYNLTKEKDKASVFMDQRSMSDEMFGVPNNYKPLGMKEFPSRPIVPDEPKRDPKGRFYKKNTNVPLESLSDAIHVGDQPMTPMADSALAGFTKKSFNTQNFPEAHTVHEPYAAQQARTRNEQLLKWLGHGLISDNKLDASGSGTNYPLGGVHDRHTTSPQKDKKYVNDKDLLQAIKNNKEGNSSGLHTGILKEISATLKQIQKNTGGDKEETGKYGFLSPWRKEQQHDKERDERSMRRKKKGKKKNTKGTFLQSFLGTEAGSGIGGMTGGTVRNLPGLLGQGLKAFLPEIVAGLALTIGAIFVAKGLLQSDNKTVIERQGDLDKTRKDATTGAAQSKENPTTLKGTIGSGEIDTKQFNSLPNDIEKEKYLQSLGIKQDEIDRTLGRKKDESKIESKGPTTSTSTHNNSTSNNSNNNSSTSSNTSSTGTESHTLSPPPPQGASFFGGGGNSNEKANNGRGLIDPGSTASEMASQPQQGSGDLQPQQQGQGGITQMPTVQQPAGPSAPQVPSSSGPSTPFKGNQKEFYESTRKDLYDAAVKKGLPNPGVIADIGAAQSSIETGYGKHVVGNNYFGIKTGGGVGKGGVSAGTTEVINGKTVSMNQNFAAFDGKADSASGYVDFLSKNPRYKDLINAKTKDEGLNALAKSGYATDPNYKSKVSSVIARGTSDSGTQLASASTGDNIPKATPTPAKSNVGDKLASANDQNKDMATKVASKDSPPIIVQQPQAQKVASAGPPSGGNRDIPNVRSDDPVFLRALIGDLKST